MCKGEKGLGLEIDMYGIKLFYVKSNVLCYKCGQKEVMGTIKCVLTNIWCC